MQEDQMIYNVWRLLGIYWNFNTRQKIREFDVEYRKEPLWKKYVLYRQFNIWKQNKDDVWRLRGE